MIYHATVVLFKNYFIVMGWLIIFPLIYISLSVFRIV